MSDRTIDDERTVERDDYDTNPDESGKWISAIIAVLGVWMIVEPFLFEMTATQFWNDLLVGVLLLAVGGYNYYRRSNDEIGSVGAASVAAILGLWLIVAPFILGEAAGLDVAEADVVFWNDVIVGLLTLILGAYSAYEARSDRAAVRRTAT